MSNKHTVPPSGKATVDALADNWGKLLAAYMGKTGVDHIVVGSEDFMRIANPDGPIKKTLVVQALFDGIHVWLLDSDEANAMAAKYKGGFGRS